MNEIVMIDVDKLHPHPQNPRKDLGNLTELTESIKQSGILQNLTVVPYFSPIHKRVINGLYTVLIGHRRCAAAKAAGLKQLPCVIVEMDEREQIATMLVENMQRSDLTVIEQADSFQMLLDMGETVATVAEKSGFSESTVRRRVKLLEYDRKKLTGSIERGGTLADYVAIEAVDDPEAKNKLLDAIGTADFKVKLKVAVELQNHKAWLARWEEQIAAFAEKLNKVDYSEIEYVIGYSVWDKDAAEKQAVRPKDISTGVKLYYHKQPSAIYIYREKVKKPKQTEMTAEEQAKEERKQQHEQNMEELKGMFARHRELRQEFIKGFTDFRLASDIIAKHTAIAMTNADGLEVDADVLEKILPFGKTTETLLKEKPRAMLVYCLYAALEEASAYAHNRYHHYDFERKEYVLQWEEFEEYETLPLLHAFLEELGYEISTEEQQVLDGSHEIFQREVLTSTKG